MIPVAPTLPRLACLALLFGVSAAAAGVWAPEEPVWAGTPEGRFWRAYSLSEKEGEGWDARGEDVGPATAGEICATGAGAGDTSRAGADPEAWIRSFCAERSRFRPLAVTVDLGAFPMERRYPLGVPFEKFSPAWQSQRVDPEIARQWSQTPSLVETDLQYPFSPHTLVHFRLGLHRDLAAWHGDPMGSNLPLGDQEVDLNEPSLGYFHAENGNYAFTIGRFPVHWSPSPEFGLALSNAVPFHNGAEFALKAAKARYRFLVSSLNPWLEGTPAGDSSSEDYPPGSEEYRQRHYGEDHGAGNFHKRVYAERIKTLFAHRVECDLGAWRLGLTETEIIGGKFPDFRDAGPFVVFHDDFKDGYTNSAVSLDAAWRLPWGVSLAGEMYIDDLKFSETETEGNTASLLGYLFALRHSFRARGWLVSQSFHVIRTDPYLYGYLQPLNSMASRQVLASNYGEVGSALLTDRYVVDYPIGYLRGGDAFDFWYRADAWLGSRWRVSAQAAVLAKGEVDLASLYQGYYSNGQSTPTGTVEREFRLRLEGEYRWRPGVFLRGGIAGQCIWNQGHEAGDDAQRAQASASVAWTLPI